MSQLEQQMKHRDKDMVPRVLVQAMFGLMLAALGLVTYAQLSGTPNTGVLIEAPIVDERAVVMTGDRVGVYVVSDTAGNQIAISSENKGGFIGVIGRVIDRERMLHGVTSEEPIRVVRRSNGNVAVLDDTTGMAVELIGYGADNIAAFARLLD